MYKVLSTLFGLLTIPKIGVIMLLAIAYQLVICWLTLSAPRFIVICLLVVPLLFLPILLQMLGHLIVAWLTNRDVMLISLFRVALYRWGPSGPWRIGRTPLKYPGHVTLMMGAMR